MNRRTDGRTDGRTHMMKVIVAFKNFANAPNTGSAVRSLYYISVFSVRPHIYMIRFQLLIVLNSALF
jgi:hypothetical protein